MAGAAEAFVAGHARAILVTHRRDGGVQASPVRVLIDGDGSIVACTRKQTAKVRNLGRDARCALCVVSDEWNGPWMTIEATATVLEMPDALAELRAFYLQRDGSVAPDDEFTAQMESEQRVILRFAVDRVGGTAPTN